jgi:RNA polymerase sigma-70 factor (ECF subfamily)
MAWTFARTKPATPAPRTEPALDVRAIHDEHAEFVWKSLLRLGVREHDAEDVLQSVFLVVHRRLASFDGSSLLTTWLFGICLKLAAAHRRKASTRLEEPSVAVLEEVDPAASPEETLAIREGRARLHAVLDTLAPEKRAVFELDEMPCDAIAEIVGVPLGTVYSRLSAARREFAAGVARFAAKDASRAAGVRGERQ